MYKIYEIIEFIKDYSGLTDIDEDSDIVDGLGITRDDFHELIQKYSAKFCVNMDNYLWYFHATEEGGPFSIGGLIFPPPYKKVNRIALTPNMLLEYANKGDWGLKYPEHRLIKRRYDLILNQIVLGAFIVCLILWIVKSLINK